MSMRVASRNTVRELVRKQQDVTIGDLTYRLREMNGTERDEFEVNALKEETFVDDEGKEQTRQKVEPRLLRARLVALTWVDDTGARCYADDEVQMLSDEMPASTLGQLFDEAQKLNGLDKEAVARATKNSAPGQVESSTSSSPAT
jgi:hypothetical protein